jgi:ankyrin repeat protein
MTITTRQLRLGVCCLITFALTFMLVGCRKTTPGESLRTAVGTGNAAEVDRILAQNAGIVDDPDSSTGMTPLEWAVINGHQAISTTLLAHGANVNAYDKLGMNPLAHAVRKDNWPMVQLLLEHNARVNDVRFMKEHVTLLMIAAIQGHKSMAEHLLALGADRSARDANGMTAADHARQSGHLDLAVMLADRAAAIPATQHSNTGH